MPKIVTNLTRDNAAKDLEKDDEKVLDESDKQNSNITREGRKSAGRKSLWIQKLNDLIDIILENEMYKKTLFLEAQSFNVMGSCTETLNLNCMRDVVRMREYL